MKTKDNLELYRYEANGIIEDIVYRNNIEIFRIRLQNRKDDKIFFDVKRVEDLPTDTSKIILPEYPNINCSLLYRATIYAYLKRGYIEKNQPLNYIIINNK